MTINFFLFKIRYHLWESVMKLLKPSRREYILIFLGRYPENFRHGITAVLDTDSLLRVSIGQSVMVCRFTSYKKIHEIRTIFNRVYSGFADTYMLFNVNDDNFVRGMAQVHYDHLYNTEKYKFSNTETLDKVQEFITTITDARREMLNYVNEQIQLIQEDEEGELNTNNPISTDNFAITMDDINPILDKIKDSGMESLTEREKQILKKYAQK